MRNGAIGGLIGGSLGGLSFKPRQHARDAAVPDPAPQLLIHGRGHRLLRRPGRRGVQAGLGEGADRAQRGSRARPGPARLRHRARTNWPTSPFSWIATWRPRQASIRFENGRYILYDEARRQDTRLHGQVVTAPQPLTDGDVFQVGKVSVAFFEKATATPGVRRDVAPPPVQIPAPGGSVCEFCGVARDPATGACACSVAGAARRLRVPGGYRPSGWLHAAGG